MNPQIYLKIYDYDKLKADDYIGTTELIDLSIFKSIDSLSTVNFIKLKAKSNMVLRADKIEHPFLVFKNKVQKCLRSSIEEKILRNSTCSTNSSIGEENLKRFTFEK